MRKIGVLTSGGDSPRYEYTAIRAVVDGIDAGIEVYGIEKRLRRSSGWGYPADGQKFSRRYPHREERY